MIKKKMLSMILGITMLAGVLAGCGAGSSSNAGQSSNDTNTETVAAEETDDGAAEAATVAEEAPAAEAGSTSTGDAAESGKTLVVYYSAQGHTVKFAEAIAEELNADLFEITPVEIYSEDDLDWTDSDSRVSREHDDESLRDIALTTTEVENWDSYDTVYIGYPIWWGIAAWPVDNFVKDNDFTGKTVIPFATSSSSGMGESGEILAGYAGTGNWLEGKRFQSNESVDNAKEWAAGLTQ